MELDTTAESGSGHRNYLFQTSVLAWSFTSRVLAAHWPGNEYYGNVLHVCFVLLLLHLLDHIIFCFFYPRRCLQHIELTLRLLDTDDRLTWSFFPPIIWDVSCAVSLVFLLAEPRECVSGMCGCL